MERAVSRSLFVRESAISVTNTATAFPAAGTAPNGTAVRKARADALIKNDSAVTWYGKIAQNGVTPTLTTSDYLFAVPATSDPYPLYSLGENCIIWLIAGTAGPHSGKIVEFE